jgi:hypothetical protein
MKTPIRRLLAWLSLSLAAGAPAAPEGSPPRAQVEAPHHDAGPVGVGEPFAHEFLVRNPGESPLELSLAEASKGTTVTIEPAVIVPGAEGRVRVVVDPDRDPGPAVLPTLLRTSDPEQPTLRLELRLEVRLFLAVRPGYARYITVRGAREGTIVQHVTALDGATFRVLKVECPLPHLRLAFREARPEERRPETAGSQWRVEMTLSGDAPVGAVAANVLIETDHPKQRRTYVQVSGFMRPMFAVTPPEARLGELDPAKSPTARLVVKNYAEEPIALTGVTTTVPAVRAELEPVEAGRTWYVRLHLAEGAKPGAFEGLVRIATASPQVPMVEVPLSGRVATPEARGSGH